MNRGLASRPLSERESTANGVANGKMSESRGLHWTYLSVAVLLTLMLRLSVFNFESDDYLDWFRRWYHFILEHGRFAAFKHDFYDYNPPYVYLLSLSTFWGLKPLYAIKLIPLLFEAVLAALVFRLFQFLRPGGANEMPPLAVLLFPTVFINGALWAQSDVIHATLIVGSLYWLVQGKVPLACVSYAVAVSFKLQSVFVFPLFVVLVFLRQIRLMHLLAIPLVYLVMMIPCALAGRPLVDLLTIYLRQAGAYKALTLNAPNVYQWLSEERFPGSFMVGLVCAAVVTVALIGSIVYVRRNDARLGPVEFFELALLFAVLEPFLLPRMHERYFFTADVLAIIYAFLRPSRWFLPIYIGGASLISYFPFLTGAEPVSLEYAAIGMAAAAAILVIDILSKRTGRHPSAEELVHNVSERHQNEC